MGKVKRPILLKLLFRILLPLLLIYGLLLIFTYNKNKENALNDTKKYLKELTKYNAEKLDNEFQEIAQASYSIKNFVESTMSITDEHLFEFTKKVVMSDEDNIGSGVAFLPYKSHLEREKYAIFTRENAGKYEMSDLTQLYDYLNEDWFQIPILLQNEYWTEPFWGKASETLLMTHAVPIKEDEAIAGIAYADVSLQTVSQLTKNTNIMNGYSFIISKHGTFIHHPVARYKMNETIFSLAERFNRPFLRDLGQKMIAGESGVASYKDLQDEEKKWIVFTPITSTGWTFAAVIPEVEILASVNKAIYNQSMIMLIGLALIILIIIWVAYGISKPIRKLTDYAGEVAAGNLDLQITDIKGNDEIQRLAEDFNNMTSDLKQHINDLTETTKAKQAVESELKIARQIQESLLPRIFPPFPDKKEFDLYARNIPAKEVAGDFYDFFFLNDEKLAVIIADVSGKGISAGLFMAVTRTLLKTVLNETTKPDIATAKANFTLCQENESCMFTTMFLGIYDLQTGMLEYTNAGHNEPFIISKAGQEKKLVTSNDIALGIMENYNYHYQTIQLEKGDTLVLYTDGVTEATSPQEELFGEERMLQVLQNSSEYKLSELTDKLTRKLQAFQADNQFDDITMLFLRRNY
jgi:sigma-B regulation protein RsbU (phosphoserine phosphatase)